MFAYAWQGTAIAKAEVIGGNDGGGTVFVNQSTSSVGATFVVTGAQASASYNSGILGFGQTGSKENTFYFHAKANDGYVFAGWYENAEGTGSANGANPMKQTLVIENKNGVTKTYYAKFSELFDITLKKAENGSYTATHTTSSSHSHKVETEDVLLSDMIDNPSYRFTFKATASSGYEFLRWKIVNIETGIADYYYTNPSGGFQYTFTAPSEVYAEFAPLGSAQFIVKGEEDKTYLKLSEAIQAAVKSTVSKVIVVVKSGTLYQETVSVDNYFDAATNTYTIPSGVTLLVPGNQLYTERIGPITINEFPEGSGFTNYRLLTIPTNTTLVFNGYLCVYSTLNRYIDSMSQPVKYGQIHLCDGAKIQLNENAIANVYGYITGNINDETEVRVKPGATIYEVMQVEDWRGGTATSSLISGPVFPINNYYVQNVETNLVLESGSYEYASVGVYVNENTVFTEIPFIVPKGGKETSGLLRQADDTKVIKYYDRSSDKLIMEVISTDLSKVTELGEVVINLSGFELKSSKFVFPLAPNVVLKFTNTSAETKYAVAMLAGAQLEIDKTSTVTAKANVFVYDADQNTITTNNHWKLGSNTYGYFGSYNSQSARLVNIPSYPSPYTAPTRGTRTVQDAMVDINGLLSGPIYTTSSGARIISTEGTGKVKLLELNSNTKTQQALQYDALVQTCEKFTIPITSAQLLNADGTFSAGGEASTENGRTYTYYPLWNNGDGKPKGRWSHELSSGTIQPNDIKNETKIVYVPETNSLDVSFVPNYSGTEIQRIDKVTFTSDKFSSNDAKYDKESGSVTISVQYDATADHGLIVEPTMTVVFECTNTTSGSLEYLEVKIPLHIQQDYTPKFTVNQSEDESIEINFNTITIGQYGEALITVEPLEGNVTDRTKNEGRGYVTWNPQTLSAQSPFRIETGNYFDGVKVYYEPTTINNQPHEEPLEITATYPDVTPVKKTIILKGTPQLAQNTNFSFVEDVTIFPSESINPLFESMGNGSMDITFTFGENDESENEYVEVKKNATEDNWILKVRDGVNIITTQTIKIKAIQSETDKASSGTDEMIVTIQPLVQWNWSNLYFNTTRDNPVIVANNEEYTLEYISGCDDLLDYNAGTKTIKVGSGEECTAKFLFTQNGYSLTFSSDVYPDPRILPICLRDANAKRTYTDVTLVAESEKVSFNNGIVFASTDMQSAVWTMELLGTPDYMEFIPSGVDKTWTIDEYNGTTERWENTYPTAPITIADGETYFKYDLKPSTKRIRIACSMGTIQGKIEALCIYSLEGSVSANVDRLYIPIKKDENDGILSSVQELVLSYMSPDSELLLQVKDKNGSDVSDISLSSASMNSNNQLPATSVDDEENLYKEEVITITSTHPTDEIVYLKVTDKDGLEKLEVPIRIYTYPQSLPMRSTEWEGTNAEKYYFYTDFKRSENQQYDANTQQLTLSNGGSITFRFKGGPSYISFETPYEMSLQEWHAYWTLEVSDGILNQQIAKDTKAAVQPEITTVMRDGNTYYQVVVPIPHTSKTVLLQTTRTNPIILKNIVIDGNPDLDVVLGNHTIEHESEANFSTEIKSRTVEVTAINLPSLKVACNNTNFVVKHGDVSINSTPIELTAVDCPKALGTYQVGNISFDITWNRTTFDAVDEGLLIFTDKDGQQLATIRLLGTEDYILAGNASSTGLYTGFAENITAHPFSDFFSKSEKYNVERRQVDLTNAFDQNGIALFDYLIIYGETTTADQSNVVTAPSDATVKNGTPHGSNAKTPYYIYKKVQHAGKYDRYQFVYDSENANVGNKATIENVPHAKIDSEETKYIQIAANEQLKVYVTGFCPYATTGYTKHQEGVWFFRGKPTAQLDLYLEDCHIYSRNKTEIGCNSGKFDFNNPFTEDYARGSGGVFVFECDNEGEYIVPKAEAFRINIHTRGENVLKSNYGSFYEIWGMRAYQVSSPIQVHMASDEHVHNSRSNLTFDDVWPTAVDADNVMTDSIRTNGFLSLQKLANNAPSIDLGNPLTEVNFRGGQVELQNAQNVSDKYKTTLAISYRSGIMAAGGIELQMAYGIGTDAATEGTVNFYDGTISVIPMKVKESERKFYLMDPQIDQNGDTIKDANGNPLDSEWTSCLRCPQHTFVYGGSIGMIRTCMSPTSKGGAPTDGYEPLGRYIYDGDKLGLIYYNNNGTQPTEDLPTEKWLVTPKEFPTNTDLFEQLVAYYLNKYTYGLSSVTPDKNGNLTFWIPEGYANVKVENDSYLIPWKACMTQISATLALDISGEIGGDVTIETNEDVSNLLYCHLDDYTHAVISEHTGTLKDDNIVYQYKAPVMIPENFSMEGIEIGGQYMYLEPSNVGDKAYEVITPTGGDYKINNKVYYITTALSDTWMNFTMPFDVENIYVVESYPDFKLEKYFEDEKVVENCTKQFENLEIAVDNPYAATRIFQGKHNADFAAFFGMTMALGSDASFEEMQQDFLDWAYLQDTNEDLPDGERYTGTRKDYDWRGVWPMVHYDGSNFMTSNFYLYVNNGEWKTNEELSEFTTRWEIAPAKDPETKILLHKNQTYSMLFPYCWGCDLEEDRVYWDYWTGKFLIFESTTASEKEPHEIAGKNAVLSDFNMSPVESTNARLTGNKSFAQISYGDYEREDIYAYQSARAEGEFMHLTNEEYNSETGVNNIVNRIIYPTNTVLLTNFAEPAQVLSISHEGKIRSRNNGDNNNDNDGDNTTTDSHIPTVGGGNDLFITAINGGINIAVAEPQNIRVLTATGAIIFNGYITTAADVNLPTQGIYVISGENEVQKIFY